MRLFNNIVTFLSITFIAVGFFECSGDDLLSKQNAFQKFMEEENEKDKGHFIFKGKVINGQGEPISNVDVLIFGHIPSGWEGQRFEDKKNINGYFDFKFDGLSSIRLIFLADGYYSQELRFKIKDPRPDVTISGSTHIYDSNVVLEKIGQLANLRKGGAKLTINADGGRDVLDITNLRLGSNERSKMLSVATNEAITFSAIYLRLSPGEKPIEPRRLGGKKQASPKDEYLEVVINDGADGGFVVDEGKDRMKEAPESGYESALRIPPEYWTGEKKIHYYFKINGLYGKGKITHALYKVNYFQEVIPGRGVVVDYNNILSTEIEVTAEFNINSDGGRNTETREFP